MPRPAPVTMATRSRKSVTFRSYVASFEPNRWITSIHCLLLMQSTVESVEGNKVKLHITVPADEFERAIDAAFRKLAREVRIPGFRPGKAPRRLLEAHLGIEIAREQAIRDSVPDFYLKALEVEDLDTIAPPEFEITGGSEE